MVNIPLRVNVETKRWKRSLEIWIPLFADSCLALALLTSAHLFLCFSERRCYTCYRAWRCHHWLPLNNASDRHICLHIGEIYMYPRVHTHTNRKGIGGWFTDMSLLLLCKISVCVHVYVRCVCHASRLDITAVSLNIDSLSMSNRM